MNVTFTQDERAGKVFAGVDTHSATHWLCVLGEHGEVLDSREFPATAEGCGGLARAIGPASGCCAVGVEGAASYGAGLTAALTSLGYRVYEVLRPGRRRRRRGEGKSDPADAERAARDVQAGHGLSVPKEPGGWVGALRPVLVAHTALTRQCTALSNAATGLAQSGGVPPALAGLRGEGLLAAALGDPAAAGPGLSALASAWSAARDGRLPLEAEMGRLVGENCPSLLAMYGCGPVCAAKICCAVGGNPARLSGEASLAMLLGCAPVPASSGKTDRFRLNRGGNRDGNCAVHTIALCRMEHDPETRAWAERQRARGKSRAEAVRCLKRYIVREVWRALTHPFDRGAAGEGPGLRERRRALGATQAQAAEGLGVSAGALSRLENGRRSCRSLAERYGRWLDAREHPVGDEMST